MTTRLKGVYVAFEEDIREDDAEPLIQAIKMIRGVTKVAPIESNSEDLIIRQRVKHEFREGLMKLINDTFH